MSKPKPALPLPASRTPNEGGRPTSPPSASPSVGRARPITPRSSLLAKPPIPSNKKPPSSSSSSAIPKVNVVFRSANGNAAPPPTTPPNNRRPASASPTTALASSIGLKRPATGRFPAISPNNINGRGVNGTYNSSNISNTNNDINNNNANNNANSNFNDYNHTPPGTSGHSAIPSGITSRHSRRSSKDNPPSSAQNGNGFFDADNVAPDSGGGSNLVLEEDYADAPKFGDTDVSLVEIFRFVERQALGMQRDTPRDRMLDGKFSESFAAINKSWTSEMGKLRKMFENREVCEKRILQMQEQVHTQIFVMNEKLSSEQETREQLSHEATLLRKQVQQLEDYLQNEILLRRSLQINLLAALDHLQISTKLLSDENERQRRTDSSESLITPRHIDPPAQPIKNIKGGDDNALARTTPTSDDKPTYSDVATPETPPDRSIQSSSNNLYNSSTLDVSVSVSMSSQADDDEAVQQQPYDSGQALEEDGDVEGEGFVDFMQARLDEEDELDAVHTSGEIGEMEQQGESGATNNVEDQAEPIDDEDDGVEFFV